MGRFAGRDILERSKAFGVMAVRLARHLPTDPGSRHIGLQFLRSATSVGSNLHEADMADTVKDFCNKVNTTPLLDGPISSDLAKARSEGPADVSRGREAPEPSPPRARAPTGRKRSVVSVAPSGLGHITPCSPGAYAPG